MSSAQQTSVWFSVSAVSGNARNCFEKVFLQSNLTSGINVCCENTSSIQSVMWPPPFTVAQSSYKQRESAANKHGSNVDCQTIAAFLGLFI